MVLKGVGNFLAKRFNKELNGEEVITLGRLQDLKITLNVDIEDIFGGDGLFAFDTLVTGKSIEVTATDAEFDLDAVRLMMGDSGDTDEKDLYLNVLNERSCPVAGTNGNDGEDDVVVAVVNPEFQDSLFGSTEADIGFTVRAKDTNMLMERVAFADDTVPMAGTYMVDLIGKRLILNPYLIGGNVIMNYKRADATVETYSLLTDEVPFNVHVIHNGVFLQKDNTKAGVETELYQCRARGEFSIDAARSTASTSQISLIVLDPERCDKRMGTIKRYTIN